MDTSKESTKNGKKLKILLLFCGGTISMSEDPKTGALDVSGGAEKMLSVDPRIRDIVDIDVELIDNIDSTNITPAHWDKMIETIKAKYEQYDGFVITHGTDTLGFTSSALSFGLQGIGKPVVLTGSQTPADQMGSDAVRNFINAVRVATMDIAGVIVVFGSKIIAGTRAKKISESELDAFKAYNSGGELGTIGIRVSLRGDRAVRHNRLLLVQSGFEDNIMVVTLEPGINGEYIEQLLDSGVSGIVLRAYGAGNIPYHFYAVLEKARDKKIPVVVTTQCPHGRTQTDLYSVAYKALQLGIIPACDMSIEAATTKLMWLLDKKIPYGKMKEKMQANLAGEIRVEEG